MKMSGYASAKFLSLKDVAEGPLRGVIRSIGQGDYDKPLIELSDGNKLGLNKTAVRALIDDFGDDDSDTWVGRQIEIYQGEVQVRGQPQASLLVRGLKGAAVPVTPSKPSKRNDLDDEIPFN
jgi:hypothetical protein